MRHNQFSHYKRSDTLAGDFMRYKPNQYLICDSYGNYYLRITLPVYMQPFFEGKRTFVRSLHTSNLRVYQWSCPRLHLIHRLPSPN